MEDLEKARKGCYEDENRRPKTAEQENGELTPDFNFSSLKPILKKHQDYLLEQSIFSNVKNDQDINDIDDVLKLIDNNKINVNGKFRIETTFEGKRRGCQKICWQSVHSIGNEIEAATGKQRRSISCHRCLG